MWLQDIILQQTFKQRKPLTLGRGGCHCRILIIKIMTDIYNCLAENKRSAIILLKKYFKNNNCDTLSIIDNDVYYPYVLIGDRHGTISDSIVTKVRLSQNGNNIEFYVDDLEEWIPDNYCLSTTANNVYITIEQVLED